MTKNNGFKEKMLILVISYLETNKEYSLDLKKLEIIDPNSTKRINIKEFIDELLIDHSYIGNLLEQAFKDEDFYFKSENTTPALEKE